MKSTRNHGRILSSLLLLCFVSALVSVRAQQNEPLPIMPLPAHFELKPGEFVVDGSFGIELQGYSEDRLVRARQRFLDTLSRETGIPLWREAYRNQPKFIVKTGGPSAKVQELGEDESYRLEVTATGAQLTAPNPLGVLRGLQTFLQLVKITPNGFVVPAVAIDDKPRFPWRGLLIDSGHRFVPVPDVKRNLDGMEAVKLNVLHWRFADFDGFHIESKTFPLLHQKGSGSAYYTQEEVRDIIAYARDRGIRVVPELDMPCHATSWFHGYPELSSNVDPLKSDAMDPSRESTYKFLNRFVAEMAALFPDAYFHTGGDECDFKQWEENPRISEFMKARGLKTGSDLQAMFTARVEKIVKANKKIMMGWDEVLRPDTPKDVVIHSWRGINSLTDAARAGNRAVLSWGYYIDLNQSAAEHYRVDPLGDGTTQITPEQQARILGGEATMWTDVISHENIDNRIWPRTAAIAERFWSPREVRDVDSMYRRLSLVSMQLEYRGLRHRLILEEMLQRMTGDPNPVALRTLAGVVQPPRDYDRQSLRQFSDFTPLNRLDDAIPPESDTAREFNEIATKIANGTASPRDWRKAREWLVRWRDNDEKLQPLLERSFLTTDLAPVSRNLSEVAEIGLRALDALEENHPVEADDKQRSLELLKKSEKPQAALLLMVPGSVELLVNATRTK